MLGITFLAKDVASLCRSLTCLSVEHQVIRRHLSRKLLEDAWRLKGVRVGLFDNQCET